MSKEIKKAGTYVKVLIFSLELNNNNLFNEKLYICGIFLMSHILITSLVPSFLVLGLITSLIKIH